MSRRWDLPDVENAPCELCEAPVHLLHDPPQACGAVRCPDCPACECPECLHLVGPVTTLADAIREQQAHLAKRKAETGFDPVTNSYRRTK